MESRETSCTESGDYPAAIPLEISHDVASRADDLLREFAEDSGLETALIVDRSGALVAGISAEAEVTIEVISALVAGASGAMRALVAQLGETGAMESLHLGGDRMIYLREIVNRFILVGVSNATRPAGLVRSKAHSIESELTELLRDIRPVEMPVSATAGTTSRSLRELALRRAADRLVAVEAVEAVEAEPEYSTPAPFSAGEEGEFEIEPIFESDPIFEQQPLEEPEPAVETEPVVEPEAFVEPEPVVGAAPVEPRGILEPLDFGEPEIVIEPVIPMIPPFTKRPLPIDSPFEVVMDGSGEEEEEDEDTALQIPSPGSVFEADDDDDDDEDEDEDEDEAEADEEDDEGFFEIEDSEDEFKQTDPVPPASFFELLEEDEGELTSKQPTVPVFEVDNLDENGPDVEGDEGEGDDAQIDFDESGNLENCDPDEEPDAFPVIARPGEALFGAIEVEREDSTAADKSSADDEDIAEEISEMIDEEEEESEVRSSGPFYF